MVNRAAIILRYDYCQNKIADIHEAGSHNCWTHMKTMMGLDANPLNTHFSMEGFANSVAGGDCEPLAN